MMRADKESREAGQADRGVSHLGAVWLELDYGPRLSRSMSIHTSSASLLEHAKIESTRYDIVTTSRKNIPSSINATVTERSLLSTEDSSTIIPPAPLPAMQPVTPVIPDIINYYVTPANQHCQ